MAWVADLCETLDVPGLAAYGVAEADFADIITKAQRSSSMRGNPLKLTDKELAEILAQAL